MRRSGRVLVIAVLVLGASMVATSCVTTVADPARPQCVASVNDGVFEGDGFKIGMTLVHTDPRFVILHGENTGTAPIWLHIQDWSLTIGDLTSSVALAETPNGAIQTVQYPPVGLPPGTTWKKTAFPRASHYFRRSYSQYTSGDFEVRFLWNPTICPSENKAVLVWSVDTPKGKQTGTVEATVALAQEDQK